jgi:hypothetical protein
MGFFIAFLSFYRVIYFTNLPFLVYMLLKGIYKAIGQHLIALGINPLTLVASCLVGILK